jgi:competence protein ComFC
MFFYLSKKYYRFLRNLVLDLIFPKQCIGCNGEGCWICSKCLSEISFIKQPYCPFCRKATPDGCFCDGCKKETYLDGVIICAQYDESVVKDAIHQFKYEFVFDIGKTLGDIMGRKLISLKDKKFDIIASVPLHKKRIAYRGFNQAEVLAKRILALLNKVQTGEHKTVLDTKILARTRYTTPQMELDRDGRLKNVKDAFECLKPEYIKNKSILLIDDITTTCTTLNECAKALKESGSGSVWGIVIAQGK